MLLFSNRKDYFYFPDLFITEGKSPENSFMDDQEFNILGDSSYEKDELIVNAEIWIRKSLKKFNEEEKVAKYLSKKFNVTYADGWQVVIGADFASAVTSLEGRYLHFSFIGVRFLIFKTFF